jgi:hypothetical protein
MTDGMSTHTTLSYTPTYMCAGYDDDANAAPTTREGFVRIANRERYDKVYFTEEARAAATELLACGKSFPAPGDVVQGI